MVRGNPRSGGLQKNPLFKNPLFKTSCFNEWAVQGAQVAMKDLMGAHGGTEASVCGAVGCGRCPGCRRGRAVWRPVSCARCPARRRGRPWAVNEIQNGRLSLCFHTGGPSGKCAGCKIMEMMKYSFFCWSGGAQPVHEMTFSRVGGGSVRAGLSSVRDAPRPQN